MEMKREVDEFCENYDINSMGITVEVKNGKKNLQQSGIYGGQAPNMNWIKQTGGKHEPRIFRGCKDMAEQIQNLKKLRKKFRWGRALDTSVIHHIDVDILDEEIDLIPAHWWDFINSLKERTSYYKSATKKEGLHLLFKTDMDITKNVYQTQYTLKKELGDKKLNSKIEILTGQWGWIPAENKIVDKDISFVSAEALSEILVKEEENASTPHKIKPGDKRKNNKPRQPDAELNTEQKMLWELGHIIDLEYLDDYDTWCKIVWSLSNDKKNNNYSIAKAVSERSDKYEEDAFNRLWDNSRTGNSIGTYYFYAMQSDMEKYSYIRAKYWKDYTSLSDDDSLANFYIESHRPDHIYSRKESELLTYYKGKWSPEGKEKGLIKLKVPRAIKDFAKALKIKITAEMTKVGCSDEELDKIKWEALKKDEKEVNALIKCIGRTGKINSVVERCIHYLSEDNQQIDWEHRKDYYAFTNVVWDLSNFKIVEPEREDYILCDTGYTYEKPKQKDIDELKKIIGTILSVPEERDCYMHSLALAITGYNPEVFVIANGGGRNGKGVINELVEDMLGQNYFYTAPADLLLNAKKLGGSPELSNMNLRRMVLFREPDPSKRINTAFLKELTGGKAIAGRKLYSNDMLINLSCICVMEANEKPMLAGNADHAIGHRIIDLPFRNSFTDNKHDLEIEGYYPMNKFYKTGEFRNKYKIPLFHIIMEYMKDFKAKTGKYVWETYPLPKCIMDRSKAYVDNSDQIKVWLRENLITTAWDNNETDMLREGNYTSAKEIYNNFKSSDIYMNMDKNERRKHTEQFFKTYLGTKEPYRRKWRDRVGNKRSVLLGYNIDYGTESDTDNSI